MGQKLYTDRIGALSFSTPNVLLAASILTIGGQQYVTSALSVSVPVMTANTLYMVYAVQTAGVVSLVISVNVNSVGPTGYSSWKLVGAFYTDGTVSPTLGTFVTIDGVPTAQTPVTVTLTVSNIPLTSQSFKMRRVGDKAWIEGYCVASGAATGNIQFALPFVPDTSKLARSDFPTLGTAKGNDGTGDHTGVVFNFGGTGTCGMSGDDGASNWNPTVPFTWANTRILEIFLPGVPNSAWTNTPLKDL